MNTTYQFFTQKTRFPFIQEQLGEHKAKIISEEPDGSSIRIEITINDTTDILRLFHAGINYGVSVMTGKASI